MSAFSNMSGQASAKIKRLSMGSVNRCRMWRRLSLLFLRLDFLQKLVRVTMVGSSLTVSDVRSSCLWRLKDSLVSVFFSSFMDLMFTFSSSTVVSSRLSLMRSTRWVGMVLARKEA